MKKKPSKADILRTFREENLIKKPRKPKTKKKKSN